MEKQPRKKNKIGLILFIIILILALGGAGVYYFTERQKPKKAVEDFLTSIQQMDFTTMESLLQSNDLSALDNADVRDEAYTEFFKLINGKMTYEIRKNKFDIQNGTAQITARITYIDGSEIYKETISEFLRQIVSTAFSGDSLTEEETQQKLSSILLEKAASIDDKFTEADITYPVIQINNEWKIVSLDDETVKIMSANFKSVEDEIAQSMEQSENSSDSAENVVIASEDAMIDMTTERFTIKYTQYRIAKDFAGNPCLMFYYDYTNNSSVASSAMVDVSIQAYQNGELLDAAIAENNDDAVDRFMSEIQPGQTVNVCQVFSLNDDTNDVTLMANEAFNFGDTTTSSQIVKVR